MLVVLLAIPECMKNKMHAHMPVPAKIITRYYSKICVKQPLKIRQNKDLMTIGSLMKVESIAECPPWSILQYF